MLHSEQGYHFFGKNSLKTVNSIYPTILSLIFLSTGMAGGGMGQAMGGYYGAAYGPLGASMAAAAAAAAQQNAISVALTPNAQVNCKKNNYNIAYCY